MKTLSLSIFTLALAVVYAGFTFSQRPVQPIAEAATVTKPAELLEWEDEQVQKFLDSGEGLRYPTEDWYEERVKDIEEFTSLGI